MKEFTCKIMFTVVAEDEQEAYSLAREAGTRMRFRNDSVRDVEVLELEEVNNEQV